MLRGLLRGGRKGIEKGIGVIHRVGLCLRDMGSGTTQTPFHLPIPHIFCQTSPMKNLTATICLTIAVLLGSMTGCTSGGLRRDAAYHRGDYAIALREIEPLAKQGDARSQYNLGLMYRKGEGVLKDDKTAMKWYRLAAEQGFVLAQYNLGLMYNNGKGVPQDYKTAVKWHTRAAEQGDTDAQHNLGYMYYKGWGVLQDYVYAHMWWNIAASSGNKTASKNRDKVAKRMTPPRIEDAQKLARECVRKNYKGC